MADSCKGDDSDDIDYQYHKKFSDEDWNQNCMITWNHFFSARNQRFLRDGGFGVIVPPQLK